MKKTLITLAALAMASVASADYASNVFSANGSGSGSTTNAGEVVFTFHIELTDTIGSAGTILAYYNGGASDTPSQNTYLLTAGASGTYTLTIGRSNSTTDATGLTWGNGSPVSITGILASTTYTLTDKMPSNSGVDNGRQITLSADGKEDLVSGLYDGNMYSSVLTGSLTTGFNTDFAVPTVTPDTPTESVPEPTTATLSLLALAGLAARRRRK